METHRSIEQLREQGIQFISRDSLLRSNPDHPAMAKVPEPPLRPIDPEEREKIEKIYPDTEGMFNMWESGLTPIGRLDTKTSFNALPQTIYDNEQVIKHSKPGSKPYPIDTKLVSLSNEEWLELSNAKKAMHMVVVDNITGELTDTLGMIHERFPRRDIKSSREIEGTLFQPSSGNTYGTISLNGK